MRTNPSRPYRWIFAALATTGIGVTFIAMPGTASPAPGGQMQVPTTAADFFQPGSQPEMSPMDYDEIQGPGSCANCHAFYDQPNDPPYPEPPGDDEPYDAWVTSMMAQAVRDPVWQAAVDIANQDAAGAGETCIRCHSPRGWLEGRSTNGLIDDLDEEDFNGVMCHFCHRLVDPVLKVGSPVEDDDILNPLTNPTIAQDPAMDPTAVFAKPGNGRWVFDPTDVRRGPLDDVPQNLHFGKNGEVPIIFSQFHRSAELCGSCHDVGVPTYSRQPDGSYELNALGAPHPTQDPHDMFPEQRTYSEWLNSDFATVGVVFEDGRFGGALTETLPNTVPVGSCQDCHMPDQFAGACAFWESPPFFARPDMPKHAFIGANSWVLRAVLDLDTGGFSGLNAENVAVAEARNALMVADASDLDLSQVGDQLNVRITNLSGHKLPTGYPEGRRVWVNVQFRDADDDLVAEIGHYDAATAELDTAGAKIYHAEHGISDEVAGDVGLPAGPSHHVALNGVILFDNRIPAIGFTNAAYDSVGAAPVGYTYADGQYWDDSLFNVPACATQAQVRVYYQTTSKEYIEFLRDTNDDQSPTSRGQIAYDQWVLQGKSAPVLMDDLTIALTPGPISGDINLDGIVDVDDLIGVILGWGMCGKPCPADTNCDGVVDVDDLVNVILNWSL